MATGRVYRGNLCVLKYFVKSQYVVQANGRRVEVGAEAAARKSAEYWNMAYGCDRWLPKATSGKWGGGDAIVIPDLEKVSGDVERTSLCQILEQTLPGTTAATFESGPKVYDVSKYLDDHPGGAEVMLDVAGQDADEFFEDIGHSKEARTELKKYLIGSLKMDAAALEAQRVTEEKKTQAAAGGSSMAAVALVVAIAALAVYQFVGSK